MTSIFISIPYIYRHDITYRDLFIFRYLRFFLNHHVYYLFRRSYYYNLDLTILITCSNFRGILLLVSTSLPRFRRAIDSLQNMWLSSWDII
ncbi:hypothetical protein HanIR_Chr15g0781161 [Helianthus annuus]|nr:hypothetical protein HanIR_Chr15g0781161 [Helianthus annuus]